jgi:hypothetical protein
MKPSEEESDFIAPIRCADGEKTQADPSQALRMIVSGFSQ